MLAGLDAVSQRGLPPSLLVQQVIDALGVPERLSAWGDGARRMANLDSLVAVAREYEESARESGNAATLTGLIAHLEQLEADEADETRPPYGVDAVTILTYHRAKGLEWPVVVLTDLNFEREPDMWSPSVDGPLTKQEAPLEGRSLRYWPWPFGRSQCGKLRKGSGLEDRALDSAEGARASKLQLEEGLRLLYVGFTRARDKLVLAHRAGPCGWLSLVPEVDRLANPDLPDGEHEMPEISTTCVVKRLSPDLAETARRAPPTSQVWLAPVKRASEAAAADAMQRYHLPSGVRSTTPGKVTTESIGDARFTLPRLDLESRARFGEAVHGFFAAWPSMAGLGTEKREAIAKRCLRGFGADALLAARELTEMGTRFHRWVEQKYPEATWRTEVPVTAPRGEGGQWDGIADLLLYASKHEVVVVDHKSSPIEDGRYDGKAGQYAGQLAAYREALAAQGLKVKGMWIHFPLAGVMALVEPDMGAGG